MNQSQLQNKDIIEFSTLETKCVYLSGERMKMEYKYIKECPLSLNTKLVQRGWRRFGFYYSRPTCRSCSECLSLRIDVNNFKLSSSAKRIIKKNRDTRILIRKPAISKDHLKLYEKYHRFMQQKKGWDYYPVNENSYYDLYASGAGEFGYEVLYIRDQKLIGVDLIDFIEDGISSIYFYYDPDYSHLSLGKFSLYKQIEFAKKRELEWIYLGYYVKYCNSLKYKAEYKPYQILKNNPSLQEKDIWQPEK